VFRTANPYLGYQIGGLSGADAICQSEANTASYSGTYKAIMSDDSTSASSRLALSYPIVNAYDGSTVAALNLWGGTLTTLIKSPSGAGSNTVTETGTTGGGAIDTGNTCGSWSNSSDTFNYGQDNAGSNSWSNGNGTIGCTYGSAAIYCIQQ
jgi:hypothetical protein